MCSRRPAFPLSSTSTSAPKRAISCFPNVQHFIARILRHADTAWDGKDPDEFDPTYEEEFAAFRARWPRFYRQDTPDRT